MPAGFRANSSFQVIISVSKVSIETPLSGGQSTWGNMARGRLLLSHIEDLHKMPNYLKLQPDFHLLSSQTSPTRIRARMLFICIIPQWRCIFSNIAYLDIFFNEYSHANDAELFSDLHYRPWWYMKESARFDMWGKMIKLSGERSLWRQQVHNIHCFQFKRKDNFKNLKM